MKPVPGNEERGCSDHGCVWGHRGGMGTNGGCHCLPHSPEHLTKEEWYSIRRGIFNLNQEIRTLRRLYFDLK